MEFSSRENPALGTPKSPDADDGDHRISTFHRGDLLCDRFRVLRFIARGGMGEVYEAEDLELGDRVALKTIRPEIAADDRINQRFRREAHLARKVTHPNICRIFDLFHHVPASSTRAESSSVVFVTMELLQGETLADRLKRDGRMSAEQAFPIIVQMAAALAAAHGAGIVHRDLKTNNVMLLAPEESGASPRVVVTDFGLAYKASDDAAVTVATMTRAGEVLGTPDYMAPEQIEGVAVTAATDIYALGIVMYEMVTGVRPFAAATPMASALQRISAHGPKPPRECNRELPSHWDSAILRCLARWPGDRFLDATSVVDALAERPPTPREPRAIASRAALWVAAAVLVLTAGTAAWRMWTLRGASSTTASRVGVAADRLAARRAIAVLGFRNLTGRTDTAWLAVALSEMLTTELAAGEQLRTISGENINRIKVDLELADADSYSAETLSRIRRNLGTDLVVVGSYVTVGEGQDATFRFDIRVQNSDQGDTLAVLSESGRSADLLNVVSRAGTRLRERLGVKAGPEETASVRSALPASPEAARLYSEGLIQLRRFERVEARDLLERAIAADPAFPLAHSALAQAWSTLGYDGRALEESRRAFELSSNLPRADRLQVEGTYREASKAWPQAIGIWQTLSTFFPDDVEYALRLANVQIASGAAKAGLSTVEAFRNRFPDVNDPRLTLAEAAGSETLSDFRRMQSTAAAAAATGDAQGAHQLVASARLLEGGALLRMGETTRAVKLFEDAHRLYIKAGDRAGVARTLNNLAAAMSDGPQIARAVALYEEGLAIARAVGDQKSIARLLNNLAIQERRAGNLQSSLRMNRESLAIRNEIGDRTNAAISLNNIGNVLLDLGDPEAATEYYEQSAAMSRELGDRRGEARARHNAGFALRKQGELTRARAAVEEGLKIRRGIADPASVASSLYGLGFVAALQGDLAVAKRSLTESLEMERRLDLRSPMAATLVELSELALQEGDLAAAQRLCEESLKIRTALGEKGLAAESRHELALIALEDGRAAEAETLAREAAAVFQRQKAADSEGIALATLALALEMQHRRGDAMREIVRARQLTRGLKSVLTRLDVAIAGARLDGDNEPSAGLKAFDAIRAEAVMRGMPKYEFLARRAISEIVSRKTPAAGTKLAEDLRKDAKSRGYGLYTRALQ